MTIFCPDMQGSSSGFALEYSIKPQAAPPSTSSVYKPVQKPLLGKDMTERVNSMLTVQKFKNQPDPFGVIDMVTLKDLMNARVHLGHHAGCWTRYVRPYLYGIRNGMHIFNLDTTLANLHRALNVVGHVAYQRGVILFLNERPQFEALTQFTARECKEYYVTSWRPGTLTNSFKLLKTVQAPDLMIFLSVPRSKTALKEVLTCGVPMVGVVDSDCNPNFILYPVPGNDDSLQAVQLYCDLFCEVILRAKMMRNRDEKEALRSIKEESDKRDQELIDKAKMLDDDLKSIY